MTDGQTLEIQINQLMGERKLTLSTCESCTGGLIVHRLTNISGSSGYVIGGFVTYSNEAKMKFAHVRKETLDSVGAVSQETALEMAHGTRIQFGTDICLSVTGIAGPGGGTETKPVGLTYIALCAADFERVERYVWTGNREANKASSAQAALQLLYDYLSK
jgi:nicotinamide-nucleotide amidase